MDFLFSVAFELIFYGSVGYSKVFYHILLNLKLKLNHIMHCENLYYWKGNRFSTKFCF